MLLARVYCSQQCVVVETYAYLYTAQRAEDPDTAQSSFLIPRSSLNRTCDGVNPG